MKWPSPPTMFAVFAAILLTFGLSLTIYFVFDLILPPDIGSVSYIIKGVFLLSFALLLYIIIAQLLISEVSNSPTGFIEVDVPESKKQTFHDLLLGFETYAKLNGYKLAFSILNTEVNKLSYKFKLLEGDGSITSEKVRQDFFEYVNKVTNGANLDDLPFLISETEHHFAIAELKNRITLLNHNLQLERNRRELGESLLEMMNRKRDQFFPVQVFNVSHGGKVETRNTVVNKPGKIQITEGGHITDESNVIDVDNSIHIADSFNERNEQIEAITKLIDLLEKEKGLDKEKKEEAISSLTDAKDELQMPDPNPSFVERLLSQAKDYLGLIKVGEEIAQYALKVYGLFNL